MGKLAGFSYRETVKRLKVFGFAFDRQAAGSHEIWYNELTDLYTTIPQSLWRYSGGHIKGDSKRSRHRAQRFLEKEIAAHLQPDYFLFPPSLGAGLPEQEKWVQPFILHF